MKSSVVAEVKFDWIIVTSPEAATVFLRAWKYVLETLINLLLIEKKIDVSFALKGN